MQMARTNSSQLNVRSEFASQRARELAKRMNVSTTKVVEEALRRFHPPEEEVPEGMMRVGRLLVMKDDGRPKISVEEAIRQLDETREEMIARHDPR